LIFPLYEIFLLWKCFGITFRRKTEKKVNQKIGLSIFYEKRKLGVLLGNLPKGISVVLKFLRMILDPNRFVLKIFFFVLNWCFERNFSYFLAFFLDFSKNISRLEILFRIDFP